MSKETGIIILGLVVVVLPFLGFPENVRMALFVLCGGALMALGFLMRNDVHPRVFRKTTMPTFAQNEEQRELTDEVLPSHHTEAQQ